MSKTGKKILKIVLIIAAILPAMAVVGFIYLYHNGLSGRYANTEVKEGQIKVACVGDSITYGYGISKWKENNYPAVLQALLGEDYHVANFGSNGSCVSSNGDRPYADRVIYQESLAYDADILVFMLGTNDSRPKNWTDISTFYEEYKKLLDTYLNGENQPKVYIGTCAQAYYIEDVAKFDIQPAVVDEIAALLQEMYAQSDMEIIDIHGLTAEHPEWFEKDGIHPNNDGAKAIAEMVAGAIQE